MKHDREIVSVDVTLSGFVVNGVPQWILTGNTEAGQLCYSRDCGWNCGGAWTGYDTQSQALAAAAKIMARVTRLRGGRLADIPADMPGWDRLLTDVQNLTAR